MSFVELHAHSEYSNLRLIDSTNKLDDLLWTAARMGLSGIALTDHEALSGHIKALLCARKIHEEYPDFSVLLGNEIYLCNNTPAVTTNDGKTRYEIESKDFYHFILIAKDAVGHRQLRELSSRAWSRVYTYKRMERVPTFKSDIEAIVAPNLGHLVASSACLGGEVAKLLLAGDEAKAAEFISWCQQMFGKENFFLEMQPSLSEEQKIVNQLLYKLAQQHGTKCIVTNDVHYLTADKAQLHAAFLRSKDEERETGDFYESCYLKTSNEIRQRMEYLPKEVVEEAIANTLLIKEMCKDAGEYNLFHDTIVPQRKIEIEPIIQGLLKDYYGICPSVKFLATSPYVQDRFLLAECEKGLQSKKIPITEKVAKRIDIEAQQLLGISEKLGCRLTAYYNLMQEILDVIWQVSIVGAGRGSAGSLYIAYLMGITSVDSLTNNLPYWRHTHVSKVSLPDVDIDLCPSKRPEVFELLKQKYGYDRCLNIATFKTQTMKSAIKTACRGLGIDDDAAQEMATLVPVSRGRVWSYKEIKEGNDDNGHQPVVALLNIIKRYPRLDETIAEIEGLITARGSHASGFYVFNSSYLDMTSMMKTPSGLPITSAEMKDVDLCGGLKVDLLVTDAIEKIQSCMTLLIKDKRMDWQGSWKATYDKYLHPDVINYTDGAMWDAIGHGDIVDLFQFMSAIGIEAIQKIKPRNIDELATASSVMRLMAADGEEQPIDKYVRHKNNIQEWYQEMTAAGLTKDEQTLLEKYMLRDKGVSAVQETLMEMAQDIACLGMKGADSARKILAKKLVAKVPQLKKDFFEGCKAAGRSEALANYVWTQGFLPQLGYSFSLPHVQAYAMIAIQQANLYQFYPHVYWQCACLTVNASATEDNDNTTNYAKTAKAIDLMKQNGIKVSLPAINDAGFSFTPVALRNEIVFGMGAISGVPSNVVATIISNRPYTSLLQFCEKNHLARTTMISLIKAGCFDEIEPTKNRYEIMMEYVSWQAKQDTPPKQSLNMQNWKSIVTLNMIPAEYSFQGCVTNWRACLKSCQKQANDFILTSEMRLFFENELVSILHEGDEFDYSEQGVIIHSKPFEKWYKKAIAPDLLAWLQKPETLQRYNERAWRREANITWQTYCTGTIPHWEMETVSYYSQEHELAHANYDEYAINHWKDIPTEPIVEGQITRKQKDGTVSVIDQYHIHRIIGTVLDKNKTKHNISLLTPDGVVTVKYYDGAFAAYDKQISTTENGTKTIHEKSWFTRGTLLMISGIRRGDTFFPKRYFNTIYRHTTCLIKDVGVDGKLKLQQERYGQGKDDD